MPGPYKVILSHDARLTLGDGEMHHFSTMLAAANYFAKAAAPHKACVYDDGCEARDLNPHEQRMLHDVCELLGLEVVDS